MKRIFQSLLLAVLLVMLTVAAMAEENLFDTLQPLMDAAAADQLAGEMTGSAYVGVRPMGADVSPDGSAVVVLGDLYCAEDRLDRLSPKAYGEVEWLDRRVVVQLEKDGGEAGWKVVSFRLDAELLMEDAAQAYFAETMRTFSSSELGFSVQYPAALDIVVETSCGISAADSSRQAFFLAERIENSAGLTLEMLCAQALQQHPDAKEAVSQANGVARVTWWERGVTTADIYAVSGGWIYHAQLSWADALNADFVRCSEYVMNSLSVDDLGIG